MSHTTLFKIYKMCKPQYYYSHCVEATALNAMSRKKYGLLNLHIVQIWE